MAKPAIVVLHGWGLNSDKFQPLVSELEKNKFRVFAPDLPGFGKSKPPDHVWSIGDYAKYLHEYLQKNAIANPVLLGHSFGGRISLKYAQLYPNAVRALILTGTPGYTPVPKRKLVLFITIAKVGKFFFSIPPFSFMQDKFRRWYYYVVGARDFYRAEGVMREIFKTIVREELETAMRSVRVPTLLVWGEEDIITPLWIAKKMLTMIDTSKLVVIAGTDHGVVFKKPKEFVSKISPFLTTL